MMSANPTPYTHAPLTVVQPAAGAGAAAGQDGRQGGNAAGVRRRLLAAAHLQSLTRLALGPCLVHSSPWLARCARCSITSSHLVTLPCTPSLSPLLAAPRCRAPSPSTTSSTTATRPSDRQSDNRCSSLQQARRCRAPLPRGASPSAAHAGERAWRGLTRSRPVRRTVSLLLTAGAPTLRPARRLAAATVCSERAPPLSPPTPATPVSFSATKPLPPPTPPSLLPSRCPLRVQPPLFYKMPSAPPSSLDPTPCPTNRVPPRTM